MKETTSNIGHLLSDCFKLCFDRFDNTMSTFVG